MSDNRVAGFGKDPLAPSHGESLADQSFQSLKSKEIRDSMSPTEMKFHSMTLNNPNTTGWDVQSSSEVSPDGRGFRAETLATTDGVENINGGTAEFKGRNEQRSSGMHEGDDTNFVKKASESSKTHLQEKVVVGDENAGRTEVRTSSSTSTSSSQVIQSSSTTDYDNGQPVQYLMDSNRAPERVQEPLHRQSPQQYGPQATQDVRHSTDQSSTRQHYDQQSEQYTQNRHESNTSQNVQTNETHEKNKRYVDMDKASPEYQRQVQHLMSQPGEIISNTVEYPKPNVKMITTVKRLPDGTIVRNKRYETEETNPGSVPSHASNTRPTTSNQTNQRRESQTNQQSKNYREPSDRAPSERYRHPNDDIVDNVETKHYTQDTHSDNVETKYSTVKTSNRKFSTETTSEHVQEYDDHHGPASPGSRAKPPTNSFSTHGFPSVRPNKPTQEFSTDRPNLGHPSQNFTSPRDALIPVQGEPNQNVTERRIPTDDGEVIIVSSEKRRNVKQQTNSERIIETNIRTTDDNRYQNISDVTTKTPQDFSTHGFPSVSEPYSQPKVYPDNRQIRPVAPGYSPQTTQGAPGTYVPVPTSGDVVVSSQKSHTSKHSTNTERIIETEIVGDDGHTRLPAGNFRVTTPGNQGHPRSPTGDYTVTTPGTHYTPNTPNQDFSTHGFPSVKSTTKTTPDHLPQGYPSARSPTRVTPGYAAPRDVNKHRGSSERPQTSPVKTSPSPKKLSTTIETTERIIQKEKEVDAAHRAFAASLRSSSPADSTRRDSYITDGPRHTPRSSVSSTKTFKRDMREGSHDSAPGSETSRVSTSTVTRQTPPKTVGGRTVVTKQTVVTSKNGPGPNEILSATSPRGSKSPSPGKSVTTTTTTRTITSKALPKDVPNPEASPRSSPAPSSRSSPYPSKSKSPLGEDDQSIKSYTSRPLSPSSSTRSPKPIGSKDVPNSSGQRPTNAVSDERRTVDRDTVIEETSTVVDDYLDEDVDSIQNVKRTTKQLITHETDLVPKRSPVKITSSPQQVPNSRRENTKRVDRSEEPKRPKLHDQTIQKQPTRPKTGPTTSTTLIANERKAQAPQKVTLKNVGPTKSTESPRKPQPKPSEKQTSTPKDTKPKYYDDETEDQFVPKGGYPDHDNLSETDDEPITSNVRQTREIIVQTTNKKTYGENIDEFEHDDFSETSEIPNHNKPRPNKHRPIQNEAKPNKGIEGKTPRVPSKITSTALIVNERKEQTPQKVTPKNVEPTRSAESTRKSYPKPSESPTSTPKDTKPKYYDDESEDQYVPKRGYPDHVNFLETDDEPITSNVRETSEIIVQTTNKKTIDEFEYDDISETSEIPNRKKPLPNMFQPIRNEAKPNKVIEGKTPKVQPNIKSTTLIVNEQMAQNPLKVTPGNVGPTNRTESPHKPQPKPSSRPISTPKPKYYDDDDQYVPKGSYPDRVHFSETDDEQITSKVRESSEIIVETTNKKTYGEEIDEFEYDNISETSNAPNRHKPQPKKLQPVVNEYKPNNEFEGKTPKVQTTKVLPQSPKKPDQMPLPKNIPKEKGQYFPKDRSPDRVSLSETEDELIENNYRETTEITVQTKNKHSPIQRERVTLEDDFPYAIPKDSKQEPKNYEPTKTTHTDKKVTSQPIWSPTVTATRKDTKPKRPSDEYSPLESNDEPITPSVLETSAITIQTTSKTLHNTDEKYTLEPKVTPSVTVRQPNKYELDFEGQYDDNEQHSVTLKPNKPDIFKSTVKTHVKDETQRERTTKDIHTQFIEAERSTHPELPDGAYVSKTTEPSEPTSPTFKKKGVGRRDTFEDRCRQILGMESYGDTPGTFKTSPATETTQNIRKTAQTLKEDIAKSVFEVKIEDCGDDDDDEPLKTTSVKKTTLEKKTTPSATDMSDYKNPTADKKVDKSFVKTTEEVYIGRPKGSEPDATTSDSEPEATYARTQETNNKRVEKSGVAISNKPETRYPTKSPSPSKDMESLDIESIRITTKRTENSDVDVSSKPTSRSPSRSPAPIKDSKPLKKPTSKSPSSTEPLHFETIRVTSQRIDSSGIDVSKRPTARSPSKPLTASNEAKPTKAQPLDVKVSMQPSPKTSSPAKESPKRKPDSPTKARTNPCVSDEKIYESTTIKDRLRSSTRKERTPKKPDQVDAGSSPETSPSRYTARRRSSNISVNTEIIIEHTDSETVSKKTESKDKKQTDSVNKEIVESTRLPEKMPKKIPVTERKESAPVHRVTRKDKDSKMSRSTSENIIKVKKPEASSNLSPQSPKLSAKTPDQRRPNKCFATKTINLSTTDRLLTSEDMENVVIDIQQAKSSREPSPDKIVPTPVPANLDTGKPRYPDVVQEPEDEPRRKPIIKNIPIFEEEHNNYVGCHITEVNTEKSRKTIDCSDYRDDEILNTPVVEAPISLDYPQPTEVTDDECLLSVHDKVSKFQHIAKEVTKPKPSSPFNREYDDSTRVPDDDECLLTVDEKVDKFIKTAQNLTKEVIVPERDTRRPIIEVTVQDLDTTECTYTPAKLGPSAPQRSPELVRHISRNISRQSDVSEPSVEQDDHQHTFESREKVTVGKRGAQEFVTHHKQTSAVRPQPVTADYNDDEDDDSEELIPHTASHTTILEERRQKNILARPSVFDNDKNKTPIRKTQPKYVSPVKDSEKSATIDKAEVKSRPKPETPKHSTVHEKTTTTTTSTTSRRKQQSPQRPNPETDCDYRRSSVETGVSNNITKQTKLYSTSGPKKSPQSVNKKPDRQSPLRTHITKNVKQESDDVDDNDGDVEFEGVHNDSETDEIINTDTAIRSTTTKTTGKINTRKEPTSPQKKMKENPKSSTCSSPSKNTKSHLVDITERSTQKHNTTTTTKTIDFTKSSETNESFLEKPTSKKPPHPQPTKTKITTTDSVAARRSLFENNAITNTRTPASASSSPGRRPSYMDHTKSSLEHIRRDSLELNKTNYTRKPSDVGDEDIHNTDRDTQVKFDVPQKTQKDIDGEAEYVDVEEIFDLEILERMIETVTSYELRRRIRAQIRLVKKNLSNVQHKKSETITTTKSTKLRDRSASPVSSVRETGSKVTTKKQYYYREEERTSSSTHTSPERTTKVTRVHSPESKKSPSPSDRSRSPPHKPGQIRVCSKDHERSQSPDSTRVINKVVTSRNHYDYRNEHEEQVERTENVFEPSSPTPRRSSTKSPSPSHSPEIHDVDNSKSASRMPTHIRVSSKSPDHKVSSTMKTNARYEQSVIVKQPKRTPVVNVTTKGKPEQKTPVWADRKNVLKTPVSTTAKKPSSVTDSRTSSLNKTIKSTSNQSQKHITNKSTYVEDDSITSSYGIGPTDENGLPLFGIRALKKKKPTSDACETNEEVTGYVVEEKYYSDNKSKPLVERKEIIYSTNPKELDAMKEKLKETTIRKSQRGEYVEKSQPLVSTHKTSQKTTSVRSSPEDSYLESSSTKYVRRGSVKEMSEKFIHKESSSSVSEKSNNYPKAGLILRTNSRRHSRDDDALEGDNTESYETRDCEEDNNEGLMGVGDITHSSHILADDSESECESVQTQREFKKISSSTSSSSRSFLNTKGEEKIITNVTDVLDRMRNADNVVEDGDTAEDQEARALLNKFLGASIIMKGVESTIPINRETKLITTTSTSSGKQPMKHEVKTTRVTKTIKSGSSSSPVTETTCDIEEIWDEEILKQLLEQARTYEERRKIRSRLRELMAERPEQQKSSTSTTEKTETKEQDGAVVTTTTKVTTRTVAGGTGTKTVSPFAKFKQLDRQNLQQSAKSPTTPSTPGSGSSASPTVTGNAPIFKFTDPALNARAATVKDQLLQWCQSKTKEYENVQITNFSACWVDGLAFCALIHHFLPDAFDYSQLTPENRRKNFELAFTVADEKAGIAPLLDVEDMVVMKRPDWKCVFVYVQSIYRRFRNCQ